MNRIIVIGTTGSGKSTLCKGLSKKLGIKYIELDKLFWKANWGWSKDDEFFSKIEKEIESDRWVLDGNYTRSQHLTWPKADTIIWIDLPFWLNFYQCFMRCIKRAYRKQELWPDTGNVESFGRMFSKDSILWWLIKTYSKNRKKYLAQMNDLSLSHINFVHLRSRKEVNQFIRNSND
ncbi:MAG: AAA family ATPase [Oligoflexia bacterium]|nr:AAA family ATPase [Oligoflexia bacterium]